MSFFSGRVTCCRYRITGRSLSTFHADHLDKLSEHAIGRQRIAAGDGSQFGWTAGDHILDTKFDLAKNIVNDTMQFALRIDEHKPPGDLLRAYFQVELEALAAVDAPHERLRLPPGGLSEDDAHAGDPGGLPLALALDGVDEVVDVPGAGPQPPAQRLTRERRAPHVGHPRVCPREQRRSGVDHGARLRRSVIADDRVQGRRSSVHEASSVNAFQAANVP